jgi:hypothetical protein
MKSRFATASLLLTACFIGCDGGGPELYPVSGTVKLDGEPLPAAEILLVDESGVENPIPGRVVAGKFQMMSTPGRKKVQIRATREFGDVDAAMGARPQQQYLAARFNSQTELRAEVIPGGDNKFHYDVSEK